MAGLVSKDKESEKDSGSLTNLQVFVLLKKKKIIIGITSLIQVFSDLLASAGDWDNNCTLAKS